MFFPPPQLLWRTYVGGRKSCRLKITEDSDKFLMDRPEGCEVSYIALECLSSISSSGLEFGLGESLVKFALFPFLCGTCKDMQVQSALNRKDSG